MSKNILDSRELQERLDELQSEFTSWKESLTPDQISEIKGQYEVPDEGEISDEEFMWAWEDEGGSDADDLKSLTELHEQFDSRTWEDGITFVKDSYFEEFAEELAEDLGIVSSKFQDWPYNCIDWSKAADQLQMDYSSVEFNGETYWHRD